MIPRVSEIMEKNFITVKSHWGLSHVIDQVENINKQDCFPVMDGDKVIGLLTWNDLIRVHQNRIAMDAMSGGFAYIQENEFIWKAKEMLDHKDIDMLIVKSKRDIVGIVTKQIINNEIGKHIDLLTGLYKSDYVIYKAIELLNAGKEISIIFFDVNDFGLINKNFGHVVGDIILKELAELLMIVMPKHVYLCRFGGDEFVAVSADDTLKCMCYAEKILKTIKTHQFQKDITVSVSAGVAGGRRGKARMTDFNITVSNLINIASLASTRAKKEKNHVAVEDCLIDELAM